MLQNIIVIGCCGLWAIALIALYVWYKRNDDQTNDKRESDND